MPQRYSVLCCGVIAYNAVDATALYRSIALERGLLIVRVGNASFGRRLF